MTAHKLDCECCSGGADAFWEKTERLIRDHGVAIIATAVKTAAGNVAMSYTVGLASFNKPEILVFGLPAETAQMLLNKAALMQREGKLPLDEPVAELASLLLIFKPVSATVAEDYIRVANSRAGQELPALQMVWPDSEGNFPWQEGFSKEFLPMQPALYSAQ